MTAITPRPIKDREKGRRPDIESKLTDTFHVEWTYMHGLDTADFDMDKSLHNQARFIALDEETVELYKEGVERGDAFPAVIAYRPGRSASAKLVNIDGNHRTVAHLRAGAPIDVYEVDRATKPQTIALMTFAFNTLHGRPTSEAERISQAIYLIDNGASQEAAAAAVNVPIRILKRELAKANANRRAAEVGADPREWEKIGAASRGRLLAITTDEGFHDAIHLTYAAGLGSEEVFDLVALLNTSKSGTKQRAIIKSETERYADRIQGGAGGVMATNKRGAVSPKGRLMMALGQLSSLPEGTTQLYDSFAEPERPDAAKRIWEASWRLHELALSLDPTLN